LTCKICKFYETKNRFRPSDRVYFERKANEKSSLKELTIILEAQGLKVSRETVRGHLNDCLGLSTAKEPTLSDRITSFFRPRETQGEGLCEHKVLVPFLGEDGLVYMSCQSCHKTVGEGSEPVNRSDPRRDRLLYNALRK